MMSKHLVDNIFKQAWATETVLSPWLAADEVRYRTCFHMLYDEKKKKLNIYD